MLKQLSGILQGGRQFAGVWGKFVRTVDKDGCYRMYEETNNGLKLLRSASTDRFENLGKTVTIRGKNYIYPQPRQIVVTRAYENGNRIGSEFLEMRDITENTRDITSVIKYYNGSYLQPKGFKEAGGSYIYGEKFDKAMTYEEVANIASKYKL